MLQLRNERRKKGYTQAELATKVGVTTNYVSLIEKGKKFPSLKTLRKMALALEIPTSALVEEKDLRKELLALAEQHDVTEMLNALEWVERHLKSRHP